MSAGTLGPQAVEAAVDSGAALLDLPLALAHRPGVLRFYALAADMAQVVLEVPIGRDDESGSVFRPVEPNAPDERR
jgi:hypothetical protein